MRRAAERARLTAAASRAILLGALALLAVSCATEETVTGAGFYGEVAYYDPWYWDGCCGVPPPGGPIGPPPPHPEHPIVEPKPPQPEQPIAKPPPARPSQPVSRPSAPAPMPRPAMRGGGRR